MPWDDKTKSGSPWGDGPSASGGGDGNSPWNRPGGSGGGGGQGGGSGGSGGGGGPDLEEQMRRMQERFRNRGGSGGGGRGRGRRGPSFGPFGFLAIAAVAALAWLATGVVIVDEGERAAVFRLGEYKTKLDSGLHFRFPTPIETHEIMPAQRQQETTIGARNVDERLMLTGDESIVDLQFRVFWFYSGEFPENFILNVERGEYLVKSAAESVMREVVGRSELDAIITTGRIQIQDAVKSDLQILMDEYGSGVLIESVEIQEAAYPGEVREAFADVVKASQDAARQVDNAEKYRNDIVPVAEGQAAQIVEDATAKKEEVIALATGEASKFEAVLAEYRKAPKVTRERMYLETMERVLERTDKLVLDSDSGAVPYLPIDRARSGGQ